MITNSIPQEVINAAELIGEWTRNHGYETFYIGPVADRQSHEQLRAEVARLKEELAALRQQQSEPVNLSKIEDTLYASYGLTERQAHSVSRYVAQLLKEATTKQSDLKIEAWLDEKRDMTFRFGPQSPTDIPLFRSSTAPPAQSEKNTTSLMRPATADDVVVGNTFHYADGDEGPFSVTIEEVHRQHDMWKAFTATDGCRYGLDGAMVEASFTHKAQSEPGKTKIEMVMGAISKHLTTATYPREVAAAAQYIVHRYCTAPAQSESERDAVSQVRNNYLTRTDITDSERALLIAACDDIASAMQEGKK